MMARKTPERAGPQAAADDWVFTGVPAYVKGWCCMAREGTMQRGFSDVGYLFVPHVCAFRPAMISRRAWRQRVQMLAEQVETRNQSGVRGWFHTHYPLLMTLIPKRRHREFAQGVIERGTEAQSAGTISGGSTSAEG